MLAGVGVGVYLMQQSTEFREKAAPATTLSFNAQTLSPDVGREFIVTSTINTAENQVVGVELYITFTPGVLELQEVTSGNFFNDEGGFNPSIDNELGTLSYIIWTEPASVPSQGTGALATLRFKAMKSGSATIGYTESTLVGAIQEDGKNVLTGTTPITLNIAGLSATPSPTTTEEPSVTASPSPTATAIPSVTASPSPTDADGGIGGNSSTSTPTSTLTPTNSDNGDSGSDPTSTNTPTESGASNPTSVQELPDSGVAEIALTSIGIGIFVLFIGLILAL